MQPNAQYSITIITPRRVIKLKILVAYIWDIFAQK